MNTVKKLKYQLLFVSGIIFLVSCKKSFLDVTGDTTALYRENYVKDLNSMNDYLRGVYVEFNGYWTSRFYSAYPEYLADNLKPSGSVDLDIVAKYRWGQQPGTEADKDFANMSNDWQRSYRIVRASSFIIEDIHKYRKEDPAKADYIKGQALVFRALMHFKMVNIFGQPYGFTADATHPGIPYITTSNLSEPYTRQSVKEVYDAMIVDLSNAIELMRNVVVSDNRYLSLAAAKALLARVYLFKGDYLNALSLAKEVTDQHPLMSISQGYPNNLYYQKLPGETEVLFHGTPGNASPATNFIGRYLKPGSLRFYATNDLALILNESLTDIRSTWISDNGGNWMVTKFPSGTAGLRSVVDADYYDPIVRSSEMFLIVAEAGAKTGDEDMARQYLNALRKRSDPTTADVTATGSDLLTTIYKERRKELCFENLRLFDLLRLKMDINRTDVFDNAPIHLPYGSDKAISPIPFRDVTIMGLQQNKGY